MRAGCPHSPVSPDTTPLVPSSGWKRTYPAPSLRSVASHPQQVLIAYAHPLLGEGVAQMLGSAGEFETSLVDVADDAALSKALAEAPDVVILERNARVQAIELLREAPGALFIDVGLDAGPTWTYQRDELSAQPDSIVELIRQRGSHRASVTG
jgi:hypothetical protein